MAEVHEDWGDDHHEGGRELESDSDIISWDEFMELLDGFEMDEIVLFDIEGEENYYQ